MGCLYEFIFELVLEVFFEAYLNLMQLIIPTKKLTEKRIRLLKKITQIFSAMLILSMFTGLVFLLSRSQALKTAGNYLTFIPLTASVIQIILGLIARFILKKR